MCKLETNIEGYGMEFERIILSFNIQNSFNISNYFVNKYDVLL